MTPQEIRRAYRAKSLELHPDKNPGREVETAADFAEVANAYEVLSDAATRRDYDYVLAHPEEFLSNHYRYYRHKYRKMDGRAVCLTLVLLLSALQYANMWLQHQRAKHRAANHPAFKLREAQLKRQRLSEIEAEVHSQGKKGKRKAKKLLESEIQAGEGPSLEVEFDSEARWGRKPLLTDLLLWKVFVVPWAFVKRLYGACRWVLLYNLLGREYSFADASTATITALRISRKHWERIDPLGRKNLLKKRLWVSSGSPLPPPPPPPPPVTTFRGDMLALLGLFLTRLSVSPISLAPQVPANKEAFLREVQRTNPSWVTRRKRWW